MAEITVLDSKTIDQIAAGEVVERPASVVKELVENACDAQATAVTVEIREGGTSFIRVTDNGKGIPKEQVKKAFYRHATSKIQDLSDLNRIDSLGFRGEALSSIAAVSMVEMITKTAEDVTGARFCIEGDREQEFLEVGAPEGTTVIVRELFFNTPARKKFLKTPATEGSYIVDLMEHMALSRPDISFRLTVNRQTRFQTSGNGDIKEIIYRIYGREIAKETFPLALEQDGLRLEGLLGTPQLVRPNRNFEFFFVNGRYIRSRLLSKGLESGYQEFLMQHKFPLACLHLTVDAGRIDVNVHPSKMEVRFDDERRLFNFIAEAVKGALLQREMIPEATLEEEKGARVLAQKLLEQPPSAASKPAPMVTVAPANQSIQGRERLAKVKSSQLPPQPFEKTRYDAMVREETNRYQADLPRQAQQLDLFEEKLLSKKAVEEYALIGQIFDTYWIATYRDKLILIDQHAAHEKVKYEALMKQFKTGQVASQNLLPPIVIPLTPTEQGLLERYREYFTGLGFEIEDFGGNSATLRAAPCDLYGNREDHLLQDILNDLGNTQRPLAPAAVTERIASMACKAAVKGNHRMEKEEMYRLLEELLELENPYRCPHGRPTMITMSKQELEKKFKRIL